MITFIDQLGQMIYKQGNQRNHMQMDSSEGELNYSELISD